MELKVLTGHEVFIDVMYSTIQGGIYLHGYKIFNGSESEIIFENILSPLGLFYGTLNYKIYSSNMRFLCLRT